MFFLIRNIVSLSDDWLQIFFQCLVSYLSIHECVTFMMLELNLILTENFQLQTYQENIRDWFKSQSILYGMWKLKYDCGWMLNTFLLKRHMFNSLIPSLKWYLCLEALASEFISGSWYCNQEDFLWEEYSKFLLFKSLTHILLLVHTYTGVSCLVKQAVFFLTK